MNKPRLIVAEQRRDIWPSWEARRRMTAKELTALMGPLHVNHRDFVQRPRSLLPMENLAGKLPCIQHTDTGMFAQLRAAMYWMMK